MCARTGWLSAPFLYLKLLHHYGQRFSSLYPARVPLFHSFLPSLSSQCPTLSFLFTHAFSAQVCEDSPFAPFPHLHAAQELVSFLLHTHSSPNYWWLTEEWVGEQRFFISGSVFWN